MKNILIYTVHKAASMFVHQLSIEIAQELRILYISRNIDQYYDLIQKSSWKSVIEGSSELTCFGPIRGTSVPIIPDDLYHYSIILHLRDPRDVLTSLYFSLVYSHARKEGRFNPSDLEREKWIEEGIDEFVLKNSYDFVIRYQEYIDKLMPHNNVKFIRYEDMVSDYNVWLRDFLSAFSHIPVPFRRTRFGVKLPNSFTSMHCRLYKRHKNDFNVSSEDINRHKRQVQPGDHKRKLKPKTIEKLNQDLDDILLKCGYQSMQSNDHLHLL